jgi:hypothetical protein
MEIVVLPKHYIIQYLRYYSWSLMGILHHYIIYGYTRIDAVP